jgi:hypothetical protein
MCNDYTMCDESYYSHYVDEDADKLESDGDDGDYDCKYCTSGCSECVGYSDSDLF